MLDLSDPDERSEIYLSSEAGLFDLVVSPDGSLAAYRSNESGAAEIYLRSFADPGEQTIVSQGGGFVPFWSPDGNTLYYMRPEGIGQRTMMAARLQRGPVPVVTAVDSLFTGTYSQPFSQSPLHPDGDRWILHRPVGSPEATGEASGPPRLILVQNFFEELREVLPE